MTTDAFDCTERGSVASADFNVFSLLCPEVPDAILAVWAANSGIDGRTGFGLTIMLVGERGPDDGALVLCAACPTSSCESPFLSNEAISALVLKTSLLLASSSES